MQNSNHGSVKAILIPIFVIVDIIFLWMVVSGCSSQQQIDLQEPLTLFRENRLEQALPLFQSYVSLYPDNAEAYAWLAETYRRLGMKDDAVRTALKALEVNPCNSFAHTVLADACHKTPVDELLDSDTTWIHINKAIRCDSTNGNAWMFLCVEAMLRGKYDLMHKSAGKLIETGFLTDAILAYGRWMMGTLPDSTILITNGDMDTFPLLALQAAEDFRTDVTIAEKQWLGLKQYLSYLSDFNKVQLPLKQAEIDDIYKSSAFPHNMISLADSIFMGWLEHKAAGLSNRPIAIAITVTKDFYKDVADNFQYAGPFLLWKSEPVADAQDTLLIRNSLSSLKIEHFGGSWVSERDYSPVRIIYTKELAQNITLTALSYSEELIKAKNFSKAEEILNWAETFESNTELGQVYWERISDLKVLIEHQKRIYGEFKFDIDS